jgi:hypothetical protein
VRERSCARWKIATSRYSNRPTDRCSSRCRHDVCAGRRPIGAFAAAVGELLRGRSASIPVADVTTRVRARFEQLRAAHIVELQRGAYRVTYIALYSSYRLPAPPVLALTGEWVDEQPAAKHPGQIAAIGPDFH